MSVFDRPQPSPPATRGSGKGWPFQLSAAQDGAVATYASALRAAGLRADKADIWGAQAFYARFGDTAGWNAQALEDQLGVNVKISRFVGWLIVTQQLVASADYVVAHRPLLGRVAARNHAEFFANFHPPLQPSASASTPPRRSGWP